MRLIRITSSMSTTALYLRVYPLLFTFFQLTFTSKATLILSRKVTFTKICPNGPEVISGDVEPLGRHPITNVLHVDDEWLYDLNLIEGNYGQFIMDRGCYSPVNTVEIINTENGDRSTKKLRVSVTNSLSDDSWIVVVEQGDLPDSRDCGNRQDCNSLESNFYNFDTKVSRYFKVQILEIHGSRGGGLKKFDISYGEAGIQGSPDQFIRNRP